MMAADFSASVDLREGWRPFLGGTRSGSTSSTRFDGDGGMIGAAVVVVVVVLLFPSMTCIFCCLNRRLICEDLLPGTPPGFLFPFCFFLVPFLEVVLAGNLTVFTGTTFLVPSVVFVSGSVFVLVSTLVSATASLMTLSSFSDVVVVVIMSLIS